MDIEGPGVALISSLRGFLCRHRSLASFIQRLRATARTTSMFIELHLRLSSVTVASAYYRWLALLERSRGKNRLLQAGSLTTPRHINGFACADRLGSTLSGTSTDNADLKFGLPLLSRKQCVGLYGQSGHSEKTACSPSHDSQSLAFHPVEDAQPAPGGLGQGFLQPEHSWRFARERIPVGIGCGGRMGKLVAVLLAVGVRVVLVLIIAHCF